MSRWLAYSIGCLLLCVFFVPTRLCGQSLSTMVRSSSSSTGLSVSKGLSLEMPVSKQQAFFVRGEYLRTSSFPSAKDLTTLKQSWKLKAVPITIGYRHYLTDRNQRVVPVVGMGISYYFCSTKKVEGVAGPVFTTPALSDEASIPYEKRHGMGYGAEATLGLEVDLSRHLFASVQGRSRFIHGLAFVEGDDLDSRFTTFDFLVGLGFKF